MFVCVFNDSLGIKSFIDRMLLYISETFTVHALNMKSLLGASLFVISDLVPEPEYIGSVCHILTKRTYVAIGESAILGLD